MLDPITLRAQITKNHALFVGQAGIPTGRFADKNPGTWMGWAVDPKRNILAQVELGFGDFQESFLSKAYATIADYIGTSVPAAVVTPFSKLDWNLRSWPPDDILQETR